MPLTTLDAVSGQTTLVSTTWNHTVGSGSGRMLVVTITGFKTGSKYASAVTYNGVALTKLYDFDNTGDSHKRHQLWYLIDPAVGTNAIVVTEAGAGNSLTCAAASFFGVDTASPFRSVGVATGLPSGGGDKSLSLSVTSCTAGDVVVAFIGYTRSEAGADSGFVDDAGQTRIASNYQTVSDTEPRSFVATKEAVGATTTLGWSWYYNCASIITGVPITPANFGSVLKNTPFPTLHVTAGGILENNIVFPTLSAVDESWEPEVFGQVAIAVPFFEVESTGFSDFKASLDLNTPKFSLTSIGLNGQLGVLLSNTPKITVVATGNTNVEGDVDCDTPTFVLNIKAGAVLTGTLVFPKTLTGTSFANEGDLSRYAPKCTISATGLTGVLGEVDWETPFCTVSSTGYMMGTNSLSEQIKFCTIMADAHSTGRFTNTVLEYSRL